MKKKGQRNELEGRQQALASQIEESETKKIAAIKAQRAIAEEAERDARSGDPDPAKLRRAREARTDLADLEQLWEANLERLKAEFRKVSDGLARHEVSEAFDQLGSSVAAQRASGDEFARSIREAISKYTPTDSKAHLAEIGIRDGYQAYPDLVDAFAEKFIHEEGTVGFAARSVISAPAKAKRGKLHELVKRLGRPQIVLSADEAKVLEELLTRRARHPLLTSQALRPKPSTAKVETETEIEARLERDRGEV